jgi:hypothetical protein
MLRRLCTSEFKIAVIEKQVRECLGLAAGKQARDYFRAVGYIGISLDEVERMKSARVKWITHEWPLIDAQMSRQDCLDWMVAQGYCIPPRSACRSCPYRSNVEWLDLKVNAPADFAAAVEIDYVVRDGVRGTRQKLYLHESLQPLDRVDLGQPDGEHNPRMRAECAGICGV